MAGEGGDVEGGDAPAALAPIVPAGIGAHTRVDRPACEATAVAVTEATTGGSERVKGWQAQRNALAR